MKLGTGCPDIEAVSAYFDNELDTASREFLHISQCPSCLEKVSEFKSFGTAIKSFSDKVEVPPDLGGKIRARTEKKASHGKKKVYNIPYIYLAAAAASILVFAGALFLVKDTENRFGENESTIANTKIPEIVPATTEPRKGTIDIAKSAEIPGTTTGHIDFNNMNQVSTETSGYDSIRFAVGQKDEQPARIASSVHHVWLAGNINDAAAKFAKILASLGVIGKNIIVKEKDADAMKYSVRLTKYQLACAVKSMASDGLELLSPAQPQPEQNLFDGNGEDKVDYSFEILKRK